MPERETKSVSVEGTYDTDLTDRRLMEGLVSRQAVNVAERLRKSGLSGRTITLKVRLHDFTTLSRSTTLNAPTDAGPVIARLARGLLGELDLTGGVRLLGVGVSGLADWIQDDLFGDDPAEADEEPVDALPDLPDLRTWVPGMDVVHEDHGRGWVWGAGRGIVTVRFETAETLPGPVRSLPADDPGLSAWRPPTTGAP
jgi:DNA polymerase-4